MSFTFQHPALVLNRSSCIHDQWHDFAGEFNCSNHFHHSLIGMKQDWSRLFQLFLKYVFVSVFLRMIHILVFSFNNLPLCRWLLVKALYKIKSSTSQVSAVLQCTHERTETKAFTVRYSVFWPNKGVACEYRLHLTWLFTLSSKVWGQFLKWGLLCCIYLIYYYNVQ